MHGDFSLKRFDRLIRFLCAASVAGESDFVQSLAGTKGLRHKVESGPFERFKPPKEPSKA